MVNSLRGQVEQALRSLDKKELFEVREIYLYVDEKDPKVPAVSVDIPVRDRPKRIQGFRLSVGMRLQTLGFVEHKPLQQSGFVRLIFTGPPQAPYTFKEPLLHADPDCRHRLFNASHGGIRCAQCGGYYLVPQEVLHPKETFL